MAETVTFNNGVYIIPDVGESSWGQNLTNYFVSIPQGCYQLSGGTAPLTADLSFGTNYGLFAKYVTSTTSTPATAGVIRLARTDAIEWRNNANGANLALSVDTSDNLLWNGDIVATASASPVLSITGTIHQVIASAATGNITLSTPQNIDTTSIPDFAGLGINQSSPLAPLHVGAQNVINSSDAEILVSRLVDNTGSGNAHAYSDSSNISRSTGGPIGYNSYDARVTISGTPNFDHYASFQANPTFSGSGTVVSVYGLTASTQISSGTITNHYGLYVNNPTVTGTGAITNQYGIYLPSLTSGGTLNYGVYTAGSTPNYFGGQLTLAPTTNQLVLGVTKTTTISATAPASSLTYTIPDAGGSKNFILSGWGQIVNADIGSAAAIALTKLASTTAYYWYAGNSTGVLTPLGVTASRAVASDANGLPVAATTTATELGYVNGVTSAIQTQLNAKSPIASPTFTGNVTMAADLIFSTSGDGITGTTTNDNAATGIVGEYVVSNISSFTNVPTAGQYGDLTSISLTAGDWDVSGLVVYEPNGASFTAVQVEMGISTHSGNDSTGLIQPENWVWNYETLTTFTYLPVNTIPYRMSLTGTTTVYLKYYVNNYSVATPKAIGCLRARRVR